jgi:outer membrane protein W
MKNILLLLFTSLVMSGLVSGQEGGSVIFNYSVGFTAGSTKDFVSPVSSRGFNFDLRFNVRENISVGAIVGWNYFYEKKNRDVYQVTRNGISSDLNAVQQRFLNIIPLVAQGQYRLISGSSPIIPYAGLAIGGYHVDYEKYWSNILDEKESWEFGFAPHVGVLFPFASEQIGINLEVKYNYINFSYNEVNNISYFDTNIGMFFNF